MPTMSRLSRSARSLSIDWFIRASSSTGLVPSRTYRSRAAPILTVEQAVLEPVAEAAKAPVAGSVAVGRAVLQSVQRLPEDRFPIAVHPPREAGTASERVVQVDLRLQPVVPARRQRGAVLGLQLARVDVEFTVSRRS